MNVLASILCLLIFHLKLTFQSMLIVHSEGDQPWVFLEGMTLKLKLQYLATLCEELTHWKRLWWWEGLGAGGKGDDRGWDGWMASPTWWMWIWVNSGSWWWTGRPGVLRFVGSQRVRHDWATELNWTVPSLTQVLYMDLLIGFFQQHHEVAASVISNL